jgi:hypothetical protein
MPTITRTQWLLLLLIVLISHAALTVHSGTHLVLDRQSCELCTQHANLSYAVPPAVSMSSDFARDTPETAGHAAAVPTAPIVPYHHRAPPHYS